MRGNQNQQNQPYSNIIAVRIEGDIAGFTNAREWRKFLNIEFKSRGEFDTWKAEGDNETKYPNIAKLYDKYGVSHVNEFWNQKGHQYSINELPSVTAAGRRSAQQQQPSSPQQQPQSATAVPPAGATATAATRRPRPPSPSAPQPPVQQQPPVTNAAAPAQQPQQPQQPQQQPTPASAPLPPATVAGAPSLFSSLKPNEFSDFVLHALGDATVSDSVTGGVNPNPRHLTVTGFDDTKLSIAKKADGTDDFEVAADKKSFKVVLEIELTKNPTPAPAGSAIATPPSSVVRTTKVALTGKEEPSTTPGGQSTYTFQCRPDDPKLFGWKEFCKLSAEQFFELNKKANNGVEVTKVEIFDIHDNSPKVPTGPFGGQTAPLLTQKEIDLIQAHWDAGYETVEYRGNEYNKQVIMYAAAPAPTAPTPVVATAASQPANPPPSVASTAAQQPLPSNAPAAAAPPAATSSAPISPIVAPLPPDAPEEEMQTPPPSPPPSPRN